MIPASPRSPRPLPQSITGGPETAAFLDTGHSNAKSEGINRVIKLVARNAFGFRNADSQRLRTCCVTTRRARGHLRTAYEAASEVPGSRGVVADVGRAWSLR
ncbi:transposase [Streptomyces sp. NBC_01381]|uniref:transposase n=1 Tax=Streptomyces sp. NBC_01381 TaxID=2903845 RepID=UPI00338E57D0